MKCPEINNKGFTFAEIMIAMCIGMMLMAAVYFTFITQSTVQKNQTIAINMVQNLRGGFYYMEKDIRAIGFDPTLNASAGFMANGANLSDIMFTVDANMDGDVTDSGEEIRYRLERDADADGIADNGGCDLQRLLGDGAGGWLAPLRIATNVEALQFYYLDQNNALVANPNANLDTIRGIQIAMITKGTSPERGYTDRITYTITLPDNTPQPVRSAPAFPENKFKRELLTTYVKCRNL